MHSSCIIRSEETHEKSCSQEASQLTLWQKCLRWHRLLQVFWSSNLWFPVDESCSIIWKWELMDQQHRPESSAGWVFDDVGGWTKTSGSVHVFKWRQLSVGEFLCGSYDSLWSCFISHGTAGISRYCRWVCFQQSRDKRTPVADGTGFLSSHCPQVV